jgi:hypothetical protein
MVTPKQQMAAGIRQLAVSLSMMLRLIGHNAVLAAAVAELERLARDTENGA